MALRRVLGWSMIDMTYMSMKVSKVGSKRWDGKPLVDRPSFDDLPEKASHEDAKRVIFEPVPAPPSNVIWRRRLDEGVTGEGGVSYGSSRIDPP